MIRLAHLVVRRLAWCAAIFSAGLIAFALFRPPPQDLPWTSLRLDAPIGLFTGRKIAALANDRAQCLALLDATGIRFDAERPHGADRCRVTDAVRLAPDQALLALSPASVAPSCPIIAGLIDWQTHVVQPAALHLFGSRVIAIDHYGSYACRRMYGRDTGAWSEHATANAIDVSGFVLADGTTISVARDWHAKGPKARFLRVARNGACRLFSTVLSPDYNAAHRDHLHLDEAARGARGWRACR